MIDINDSDMVMKIKLKAIVNNDRACIALGINPWCVNEGSNGEDWIEVPVPLARTLGLLHIN